MIDTPQIVQTTAQPSACIHLIVSREEIRNVMGPTIRSVYAELAAQRITPAGPWFTHHRRRPTETFDSEVCVPVGTPVQPAGSVLPCERPAMRAARTIYRGPYEGLAEAWGEFMDWLETNGLQRTEDLWETYLAGPESSDNPADWQTELTQPLRE